MSADLLPEQPQALLRLLRSQSLPKLVQVEIERMILEGELDAGAHVNESQIANRLAISRGPVREACRALEQAGLLVSIANRGLFVRKHSLEEALEGYDVRAVLFGLAGQIVAVHITPTQVEHLGKLIEAMEQACRDRQYMTYYRLNLEFHETLVEYSENRLLRSTYREIVKKLHLFRRGTLVHSKVLRASIREHVAILEALARHDATRARRLMERHVLAGKQRFLARIKKEQPEAAAPPDETGADGGMSAGEIDG